jgi:hypothetical protein
MLITVVVYEDIPHAEAARPHSLHGFATREDALLFMWSLPRGTPVEILVDNTGGNHVPDEHR